MASLSKRAASSSASSRENQDRKYLPPKPSNREAVKVLVRCRPMSEKETENQYKRIVECEPSKCMIEISNPKIGVGEEQKKVFVFDAVFDETSSQEDVYEHVRPLVASVLAGFNGTIFAYGQTGTGKTYTMEGCLEDPNKHGIILRTFSQIFQHISNSTDQQFFVRSSYLEIYQEEIRDLLSAKSARCEVRESCERGIFVKDLSSYVSKNIKEITDIMNMGNKNRSTGATDMNEHSSRSHAIFTVTIETLDLLAGGKERQQSVRVGKLSLVDLAGSERQGKSGARGDRLKEATKINLSLSALGNVMAALVEGNAPHVPYRDSKLTRILQDSLGGNSKTIMIANVGPASYNHEETLITLRYAQRAKRIQNEPVVNQDPCYALVQEYKAEIDRLRALLAERRKAVVRHGRSSTAREEKAVGGRGVEEDRPATARQRPGVSDEERKRLAEYEEELRRSIAENGQVTQNLEVRIAEMESKLLFGGGGGNRSIVDYTLDQKRALDSQEQEIRDKKLAEVGMLLELEVQEDVALDRRKSYTSLRQEVDHKEAKLRRLLARLRWAKKKIQEAVEEFSLDRRDLENERRELLKHLKMNHAVIQNVIPPRERYAILDRLEYDENLDDWVLQDVTSRPLRGRPIATPGCRRPVSEFARTVTRIGHQHRYQAENILRLGLELPQRTTQDYTMPAMDAQVLVVLDSALEQEENLVVDAAPFSRSRPSSVLDSAHFRRSWPDSDLDSAHFGRSRPDSGLDSAPSRPDSALDSAPFRPGSGLQHGNYLVCVQFGIASSRRYRSDLGYV